MKIGIEPLQSPQGPALHKDGTLELTFGAMFLLAAFCFWGVRQAGVSSSFFGNNVLPYLTLVLFLGAKVLIDLAVKRFKQQVRTPRGSRVLVQKSSGSGRKARAAVWVGIPVMTLVLLGVLFADRAALQSANAASRDLLLPAVGGVVFGGLWFLAGRKTGLRSLYLMAVVSLAVGGALFIDGAEGTLAMVILFAAIGTALCISGGTTLWQYLSMAGLRGGVFSEE